MPPQSSWTCWRRQSGTSADWTNASSPSLPMLCWWTRLQKGGESPSACPGSSTGSDQPAPCAVVHQIHADGLCMCLCRCEVVLIVVGSSDGTLSCFMLPPSQDRLVLLCEDVSVSAGPVLCVDIGASGQGATSAAYPLFLFAGTTDGAVTVFDLGPCVATAATWLQAFDASGGREAEALTPMGPPLAPTAGQVGAGDKDSAGGLRHAPPVAVTTYVAHTMGTNCLSVCPAPSPREARGVSPHVKAVSFHVASGGDDQGLSASVVTLLRCEGLPLPLLPPLYQQPQLASFAIHVQRACASPVCFTLLMFGHQPCPSPSPFCDLRALR